MDESVRVAQSAIVIAVRQIAEEFGTVEAMAFAHRMEVELDRIYGNLALVLAPKALTSD